MNRDNRPSGATIATHRDDRTFVRCTLRAKIEQPIFDASTREAIMKKLAVQIGPSLSVEENLADQPRLPELQLAS